jgi:hypothetical protein
MCTVYICIIWPVWTGIRFAIILASTLKLEEGFLRAHMYTRLLVKNAVSSYFIDWTTISKRADASTRTWDLAAGREVSTPPNHPGYASVRYIYSHFPTWCCRYLKPWPLFLGRSTQVTSQRKSWLIRHWLVRRFRTKLLGTMSESAG